MNKPVIDLAMLRSGTVGTDDAGTSLTVAGGNHPTFGAGLSLSCFEHRIIPPQNHRNIYK